MRGSSSHFRSILHWTLISQGLSCERSTHLTRIARPGTPGEDAGRESTDAADSTAFAQLRAAEWRGAAAHHRGDQNRARYMHLVLPPILSSVSDATASAWRPPRRARPSVLETAPGTCTWPSARVKRKCNIEAISGARGRLPVQIAPAIQLSESATRRAASLSARRGSGRFPSGRATFVP